MNCAIAYLRNAFLPVLSILNTNVFGLYEIPVYVLLSQFCRQIRDNVFSFFLKKKIRIY